MMCCKLATEDAENRTNWRMLSPKAEPDNGQLATHTKEENCKDTYSISKEFLYLEGNNINLNDKRGLLLS